MEKDKLSATEAYAAMYAFLERIFDEGRFVELGALLGSMSTLADGQPADPALAEDWQSAVARVTEGRGDTQLKLR